MAYTLEQYAADCRAALLKDPGPAGREFVRRYTERASTDPGFVAKYFGPDESSDRKILYEDPDLHFCILSHVYRGARNSSPHGVNAAGFGQSADARIRRGHSEPAKLSAVELGRFISQHLLEHQGADPVADHRPVFRRLVEDIIGCDQASGSGSVFHHHRGIAGDMLSEVSRYQAGIGVEASAGGEADNKGEVLILVKFIR